MKLIFVMRKAACATRPNVCLVWVGLAMLGIQAPAALVTWDGGGVSGVVFTTPANWVGDALPGTSDDAVLDNSVVTIPSILEVNAALTAGGIEFLSGFNGANTVTLGNGSSTARTLTLSSGSPNPLMKLTASSGTVTFDKRVNAGSADLSLAIAGSGSFDVSSGATLVISNVVSGTPTTLTKTNGGTMVLAGVNTLGTAATPTKFTINGGVLSINADSALGTSNTTATASVVTLNGGTLRHNSPSVGGTFINGNRGIAIGASGGTIDIPSSAAILIYTSGQITGSGNTLTKSGAGTLRMTTPTLTTFTKLVVTGGLYQGGADTIFGAVPGSVLADQITLNGGGLSANGGITLSANRGITLGASGGTINTSSSLTYGGPIVGTGALTKSGTSTLTLSQTAGVNTYSGHTTNLQGIISINGTAVPFGNGVGTLYWSGGNILVTADRGTTTYNIPNPIVMTTDTELQAATTTGTRNLVFGGTLTGTAGTLMIHNTASGAGPATNSVRFTNTFTFNRPITFVTDNVGNTPQLEIWNRADLGEQTFSGIISGPGIVRRSITTANTGGKVTFTQPNTYSRGTFLNDGEIGLGSDCTGSPNVPTAGPLGTGAITINNDAGKLSASGAARNLFNPITFTAGGVRLALLGSADLELSGNMDLASQTVILTNNNSGVSKLSGVIGNGALTMRGSGVLILANDNTYNGATTIGGGNVIVTGSLQGAGAVTVQTNATLGGTGGINGVVTVQSGGTLSPGINTGNGIGTFYLTNTPSLSGTILMQLNTTNSPATNDLLTVVGNPLACAGTLMVTNTGDPLTGGEVFDLFNASSFSGGFTATNLPTLAGGLNWYLGNLLVDGSIKVNRAPVATTVTSNCTPGLSLAIQITGAGSLATDLDGDTLSVTTVGSSPQGTNLVFTAGSDKYIYYQNTNAAAASDSFTYTVTDGFGGSDTKTITINLAVPNNAQLQGTLFTPELIGGGSEVRLKLLGYPLYNYAVEWSTNLPDPWTILATNQADGTGLLIYTNNAPDPSQNFYRTRWVP